MLFIRAPQQRSRRRKIASHFSSTLRQNSMHGVIRQEPRSPVFKLGEGRLSRTGLRAWFLEFSLVLEKRRVSDTRLKASVGKVRVRSQGQGSMEASFESMGATNR
jgi:hypothetical protein